MTKLKKIAAIAVSTLALGGAAVTAAQAQPWNNYDRDHGYQNRGYENRGYNNDSRLTTSYVDGLDWKIQTAAQYHRISWRDARDLRGQLQAMKPIAWRVQTGQARPWEVSRLEQFVNRVDALTNGYAQNNRRWR
ncbi:hypothetical protein [Phenylobacterium sp.]|uniref:hypothetical protein n=1 Tax=Phenylobacterium sp. TaxID=1871053 RepID=UPI002DE4A743|nr:hypothetical protein [Phenylobacterium sp.]